MANSPYTTRLNDDIRAALDDRPPASRTVHAAIDAALAEVDQGRVIPREAMTAWIDSWDTDAELPVPTAEGMHDNR